MTTKTQRHEDTPSHGGSGRDASLLSRSSVSMAPEGFIPKHATPVNQGERVFRNGGIAGGLPSALPPG